MVPLVSSSTAGPLGAVHMPRMWVKAMLHTLGALPDGYWCATRGFDAAVLETFGVEAEEYLEYIASALPDYPTFEAWMRRRPSRLDAAIAASNAAILTRDKPEQRAAEDRAVIGLTDTSVRRGFLLNDLDDWKSLHDAIATRRGLGTIVPAISSNTVGTLGAAHLPRLWLRSILRTAGALPAGYESEALDRSTLDRLGVNAARLSAFVESALPDYVHYELWIRENARHADDATIAENNATVQERRDELLQADLHDWQALHAHYVAQVLA